MKNRYLTLADTMDKDSQLQLLAVYDATHGLIVTYNTAEEEMAFRNLMIRKFNMFKRGIQLGEYTFEELRDYVLRKNGPYRQNVLTDDQEIDRLQNSQCIPAELPPKEISVEDLFRTSPLYGGSDDELNNLDNIIGAVLKSFGAPIKLKGFHVDSKSDHKAPEIPPKKILPKHSKKTKGKPRRKENDKENDEKNGKIPRDS
jgi:hypothetical protein